MTLFSVALHQHSFNLFISVVLQDKLSYSQESALVPISQMGRGNTKSRKEPGPNPRATAPLSQDLQLNLFLL